LAADAVHRARRSRHEVVQRASTEILAGLAAGTVDLADVRTQQQLRVAVARLRRLIVETDDVPNPLLHELRACADVAERRGVAIDLQAPAGTIPALPIEVRRTLTEPVIQVLAATRTQARVTVVATPSDVAVAVFGDAVADGFTAGAHDATELSYHREGGQLWAQARWERPPPSAS
jgi:CHAD domain-containing protein